MTAKRGQYQPQNKEKKEDDGKGEEKKMDNGPNNFPIEGSLPLMQTKEFNDLLSDFDTKKDATINDFRIIDNNNEVNKNEKLNNIDNNNSISSDEEEKDDNKYFSDNDNKSNEEDEDRDEEEEKVTEIGGNNDNAQENVTNFNNDNNEEEKANLKRIQDIFNKKDEYDKKKNEIFFRNKSLKKEHFGKLIKNKSLITQFEYSKRESILFDEFERLNRGVNKDLSVESKRIKAQISSITNQIEYEEEIKDFQKKIYLIKDESVLTKN